MNMLANVTVATLLSKIQDYTEPMFAMLVTILMSIGYLGIVYYSLVLIFHAFKAHIGWGLLCLLVPLGVVIFVFKKWDIARTPLAGILKAVGLVLFAIMITHVVPENWLPAERAVTSVFE